MNVFKNVKTKLKWMFARTPSPSERKLNDVVIYHIQDHAYLAVYWKDIPIGKGPCVSLYVHDKEIFKFDCFGEDRGHYHTNIGQLPLVPRGEDRLYFSERSIEEQLKHAIFEIRRNTNYYLHRNFDPRITFFKLDTQRLEAACQEAETKMLEYAKTFTQ